jgi:hypothetical protein
MVMKFGAFPAVLASATLAAGSLIPTDDGMSWPYRMTQQLGDGVRLSGAAKSDNGSVHSDVLYRINGTEDVDGAKALKFEMHRNGMVTNTDLIAVDNYGIHCLARISANGERVPLRPVQTMVAAPLTPDLTWDFDGTAGTTEVLQHYTLVGLEEVTVPAGHFRAYHIHGEQTAPEPMTIERWFVRDTGIIRDITTMRNKEGEILQRIELELKEKPKVAPRPEVKAPKKLSVDLSSEAIGDFKGDFTTDTPKIYARWQGHGLRKEAKVRVSWVADDVGDVAPPNYAIDEASAVASIPDTRGIFTLSRPDGGWTPGRYRVEFYVDDELIDTVKLKINPAERPDRFK